MCFFFSPSNDISGSFSGHGLADRGDDDPVDFSPSELRTDNT